MGCQKGQAFDRVLPNKDDNLDRSFSNPRHFLAIFYYNYGIQYEVESTAYQSLLIPQTIQTKNLV